VLQTKKSGKAAARPSVPTHIITFFSVQVIVEFAFEPWWTFDHRGPLHAAARSDNEIMHARVP
jgi:hypothetical protein